jgi:O-antigen ligase
LPALALVDSRRCLFVLGGCVILSALYGIVQFHYGVDWFRLEADQMITPLQFEAARAFHGKGTFSHHLTYAGVLLLNALFFLALVFFERTRARWFWALVVVAAISGIVVSMGRSSWLGLAVGGVVLALKLPRRWSVALLGAGFALILAVIFSLSTGLLQRYVDTTGSSVLVKRFVNTSLASEKDRFYLWEAGWLGIVDRPVVGAGFGNPAADYEKYREIVAARHDDHRYLSAAEDGVHNVFLQIAYSTGVIGLAAFVWMFVALFVWCARRVRDAASIRSLHVGMLWGTAAGLVGTLVAGLFQNNYFDAEVQNMMGLMIGFALFAGLRIQEEANRNFRSSGVQSE